jgi:predicted TIM-barrel fold metal-dependent hydrolase
VSGRTAREVREALGHPIVDADGHTIEVTPVLLEHLDEVGGPAAVDAYRRFPVKRQFVLDDGDPYNTEDSGSWVWPTRNTYDRASATFPALYAARAEELGIDFSVIYPSEGLFASQIGDTDLRLAACRAYNRYAAETFAPHAAQLTPAAVIPCHTPAEAVDELTYAVRELGMKAAVLRSFVKRPPRVPGGPERIDVLALGSDHDYDPVWQACVDLGVAATFHSSATYGGRSLAANYSYNHIGILAAGGEGIAKALFMGGVTRRFPTLNFAFLEGGVGWGISLYADLLAHWERRSAGRVDAYDPAELDVEQFVELAARHGGARVQAHLDELRTMFARPQPEVRDRDNFAAVAMTDAHEMVDLFAERFWFGCEADDPVTAHAFDRRVNPFGVALKATLGSDNAHWDVVDMAGVVPEAYEMVERGLLDHEQLRAFAFTNAVELHAGMNPAFFAGTTVEADAAAVMATATATAAQRPRVP